VASCSVNVERGVRVNVDCAGASTPYQLNASSSANGSIGAASLRVAGPDAQRVTVYF